MLFISTLEVLTNMKKLFALCALLFALCSLPFATIAQPGIYNQYRANYFVSADGNDSNSGKYPWAAFKTITKLNTVTLQPGDIVAFRRGDVFFGQIGVTNSGTAQKPITFTSYGNKGAAPKITGFTTVTGWTDEGGGKYSKLLSLEAAPEIVTINNVQYAQGRTPNANRYAPAYSSYYHIDSYTAPNIITDSECNTTTTDWDNAEIVIRTANNMNWLRGTISNHTGTTLTFANTNNLTLAAGYGYFIQNDLRTLDQFGEWFYNSGTGRFYMYFGGANPNSYTVNVSSKSILLNVDVRDYITVKGLSFTGANLNAISSAYGAKTTNLTVDNCTFNFNNRAIYGHFAPEMTVKYCTFTNCAYMAIYDHYWSEGAHIFNNTIDSTGLVLGSGFGDGTFIHGVALYSAYGRHYHSAKNTII